jgi:hypothetical protein
MATYLLTIGLIFLLLAGFILVERLYRLFARRHPEFGPYRVEGRRCGSCTSCGDASACTADGPSNTPAGS